MSVQGLLSPNNFALHASSLSYPACIAAGPITGGWTGPSASSAVVIGPVVTGQTGFYLCEAEIVCRGATGGNPIGDSYISRGAFQVSDTAVTVVGGGVTGSSGVIAYDCIRVSDGQHVLDATTGAQTSGAVFSTEPSWRLNAAGASATLFEISVGQVGASASDTIECSGNYRIFKV